MSKVTRRQVIRAGVVAGAALGAGAAAAGPEQPKLVSFVTLLLPEQVRDEDLRAGKDGTYSKLEFAGSTFWVRLVDFGDSISHTAIGVYAPDKDGVFYRCLAAESWPAGILEASVDKGSGLLEVRERGNTTPRAKGRLVLACDLQAVGTQHSSREK